GYFTGGVLKIPDFTDETGLTTGEGNMFWDSDDDVLYVHNGSAWQEVGGGSGIPSGGIIMYSGPWNFDDTGLGTGPLVGWALCNGNNGTPDLSDRFVMGTVSSPTPGGTGGSTTHTHSIPNLNLKNNAGSSSSELGIYDPGDSGQRICWKNGWQNPSCAARDAGSYGYTSRFGTASATTGSASSLPPYIKLAFIMKL
ncbi:hypothetical protein J7M00_06985, partial [bacterium]|nr:hypothetical protein [bacterium]